MVMIEIPNRSRATIMRRSSPVYDIRTSGATRLPKVRYPYTPGTGQKRRREEGRQGVWRTSLTLTELTVKRRLWGAHFWKAKLLLKEKSPPFRTPLMSQSLNGITFVSIPFWSANLLSFQSISYVHTCSLPEFWDRLPKCRVMEKAG